MITETQPYLCPVCGGNIDEILDFDHFGEYDCPHCDSLLWVHFDIEKEYFIVTEILED